MRRSVALIALALLAATKPAAAAVHVSVDLTRQTMHVSAPTGEDYTWLISSARPGFVTPVGTYRAKHLERMHYSQKYDDAPMPYSIFFRGGYAIHGTMAVSQLGRPASHGCIRLAPGNAARLYSLVREQGAVISISRSRGL
jgi:lipoprotein-anchoring transpeptidase ErfK/SrfK